MPSIPVIDARFRKQFKLQPQIALPDRKAKSYSALWWARHIQITQEVQAIKINLDDHDEAVAERSRSLFSSASVAETLDTIENDEEDIPVAPKLKRQCGIGDLEATCEETEPDVEDDPIDI